MGYLSLLHDDICELLHGDDLSCQLLGTYEPWGIEKNLSDEDWIRYNHGYWTEKSLKIHRQLWSASVSRIKRYKNGTVCNQGNFGFVKLQVRISFLDSTLNWNNDLWDKREDVWLHSVKFIKDYPGSTRSKTFEKSANTRILIVSRTVQHKAQLGNLTSQVFGCLGFTSTEWAFWSTTVMILKSNKETSLASFR